MPECNSDPSAKVTTPPMSARQGLLGVFILFQLAFLFTANLLGYVKWAAGELKDEPRKLLNQAMPGLTDENAHAGAWTDQIETTMRRWTQLTGQDQDWSLFAPSVAKGTGFPAVVLLWDEPDGEKPFIKGTQFAYDEKNGIHLIAAWNHRARRDLSTRTILRLGELAALDPYEHLTLCTVSQLWIEDKPSRVEMMLSENEPPNIHHFFRVGKCRVRRYEGQFYLNLQPEEDESHAALAERLTRRVRQLAREYPLPIQRYLEWRLKAWQKANPDEPAPKQVLLFERFYRILGADDVKHDPYAPVPRGLEGPTLYPLVRWRPEQKDNGFHALEAFDFSEQRFYPMNR